LLRRPTKGFGYPSNRRTLKQVTVKINRRNGYVSSRTAFLMHTVIKSVAIISLAHTWADEQRTARQHADTRASTSNLVK